LSKLTVIKREQFLGYLRDGWSISAAAGKIGVSRQAVYRLRASDDEFAHQWEDAYESGTDVYEDEVKRRAVEGTEKPVFYQGEIVGHVREFSDTLLIVALKARRPERYRERFDVEIKDARKRIEIAVEQMMRQAGVGRTEAIDLLKPHIPQISELLH
jgi:Homeodomain-like domain